MGRKLTNARCKVFSLRYNVLQKETQKERERERDCRSGDSGATMLVETCLKTPLIFIKTQIYYRHQIQNINPSD